MTPNLAVSVLAVTVLAVGATGQQASGQLTLGGTVVNSVTGEPVKRALVTLMHFDERAFVAPEGIDVPPPPPGSAPTGVRFTPPETRTTFTDSSGVFSFNGLAPGHYNTSAQKPGFVPTDHGVAGFAEQSADEPRGAVNLTSSETNVRLTLAPLGVITGKVVDQDGMPLRYVNIASLTVSIVDGVRQRRTGVTLTTDDRGMYRFYNMAPGKYYLKADGRAAGTTLFMSDALPHYVGDEAFAPVYFGGGRTVDGAVAIQVEAGTEAHADFALTMEKSFHIRGTLANRAAGEAVKFELIGSDEDASTSRASVSGVTGAFEIQDVVPGNYVLHATQARSSADVPVTVSGSDLTGISVTLAPGVDIQAITRFLNEGEQGGCSLSLQPLRTGNGVSIWPAGPRWPPLGGESTLPGVLPGAYRASIHCFSVYARSAMFGSQDLLANPIVTVQPGAPPAPIEIQATRGGGTVFGTLTGAKPGAAVLLVPQFAESTGPMLSEVFPDEDNGGKSGFTFGSLAPGAYVAYAFSSAEDLEYRNPAFLQSLSGGVSVQVEDNTEKTVEIRGVVR